MTNLTNNNFDDFVNNLLEKDVIVKKAMALVKEKLYYEPTGHDFWHSYRVWKLSLLIAWEEAKDKNVKVDDLVDYLVLQLSSLLHDLVDWKVSSNKNENEESLKDWLLSVGVDEDRIDKIMFIIDNISFSKSISKSVSESTSNLISKSTSKSRVGKSLEFQIVQDADRLDALGAVGIARCFATGSKLKHLIFDPDLKPKQYKNVNDYKGSKTTSINHFYEKLLLLKDLMNTRTARRIAELRHEFMLEFLDRFFKEWDCKDFDV